MEDLISAPIYIKFILMERSSIDFNLLQFNFVGRLLGPRGNSLKRVEASTECRVLIRGRGSIKDPTRVRINISLFVASLT